jgi:hypothetical protein
MQKPAAPPAPPYNTDPVSGRRNDLCVIAALAPMVLSCLRLFDKFLDYMVSDT